MNKKTVSNYLLLGVLGVISILPFAIPYAYFPMSKFYSEALSLLAGVFMFALAIFSRDKIKLPPVSIACFAFSVFALIQPFFVHIFVPGNNHYLALIFFISGLTAVGINSMIDESLSIRKALVFVSWAMVVSGTIQAIIAYLQYTGKAQAYSSFILVTQDTGDGSNIFGNIGQPNQFTDFMSIAVVALLYLYLIGQINIVVTIAYSLLFAMAITFTARRGVLLYYVIMIFIALWVWFRNKKNSETKEVYTKSLLTIVAFFVGLIVFQTVWPKLVSLFTSTPASTTTALERLSTDSIGQSTFRRFYEWYKAWVLFTEHPLFGIGWYQYPREAIYIMQTEQFSYIPMNMKLYTHCHNSLLNIMAETGVIGTLIIVGYGILYSIARLLRKVNTVDSLFVVFLTMPILIHSLLEYPLWYSYFMILLAVFLAFSPAVKEFKNSMVIKATGMIFTLMICGVAYNANQVNNFLISAAQPSSDYDDYTSNVTQLEQIINSNSMWSMPAMMVLDNYIMPGSQATSAAMSPTDQVKYVDGLANVLPYPSALFKQVIVHKIVGDDKGANYYANILAHAYPYYQEQFIKQLSGSPQFADVVQTMQSFHYEDKSDLSKIFDKNKSI
ncbi:MAG: hypothetical protein EKK64_01100 [Neisseriaceae bacterium]|nr:MAG: hypothetical protein EKK64_01100 [Neisseriaceae bacterium]